MTDADWFARTLALPDTARFPAVVTRLVRGDADAALAVWEAWRTYVAALPGAANDARADIFAADLRRGVERATGAGYRHLAWVAAWDGDPAAVPESAWSLLADDAPLTADTIRAWAGRSGQRLVVLRVRSGGSPLPPESRGPFFIAASDKDSS